MLMSYCPRVPCRAMLLLPGGLSSARHLSSRAAGAAASFGKGYLGCLGQAGLGDLARPVAVPSLLGVPMVGADAGWGHSVYVGADGSAYTLGRSSDFKNTLRHINLRSTAPGLQAVVSRLSRLLFPGDWRPQQLAPPPGDPFVHASCSPGGGTALLTASGALYVGGANAFGQCGQRTASRDTVEHTPLRVTQGWPAPQEGIAGVSMGLEHVLAVSQGGGCFAWGRGDRGQLGLGDSAHYTAPVRLLEAEGGEDWLGLRIVAVEAGMSASAALDDRGQLWVWGKMQSLEEGAVRGDGRLRKDQLLPRRVRFEDEWAWQGGQGGSGGSAIASSQPRARADTLPEDMPGQPLADTAPQQPAPRRVLAVTAGQAHLSLLTDDGRLWMMGLRGRGALLDDSGQQQEVQQQEGVGEQLLPETLVQSTPMQVLPGVMQGHSIRALRSSLHHSYAITSEGRVFRWGWRGIVEAFDPARGLGGLQETRVADDSHLAEQPVPPLLDLAFGFSHGVALIKG